MDIENEQSDTGQTVRNAVWQFPDKPAREVQLEALAKGYGKEGFGYYMRMRLGKTLVAYSEFCQLREEGEAFWMIVICPNSLKQQWADAIEEVNMFEPICIYESQNKKALQKWFKHHKFGGVFIINYESLKAFMRDSLWQYMSCDKAYIVADESTKLKDPARQMVKNAIELADICKYKRVLTGRPTANSNADIWGQLRFINATQRNFWQHRHMFCMMGGWQGRQAIKNVNTDYLQTEIAPYSYIAPDKYVKGFEKVYEPMRRVALSGDQLRMYKQMEDELMLELTSDVAITAPIALVKYLRLQQISSGVAGGTDGNQHNLIDPAHNPRVRETIHLIENEVSNKVIIPCRFKLSMSNLADQIPRRTGKKVLIIEGGMNNEDVEDVKKRFNESDDYNVLISQLQVLSYGHTLCAKDESPCDSMIFYENDFSLLNRIQCESRPEKFGRDGAISYYDFYCSKMDRYILQKLIDKEEGSLALMNYAREHGVLNTNFSGKKEEDDFNVDSIFGTAKKEDLGEVLPEDEGEEPTF